jgi:hypothetical protein
MGLVKGKESAGPGSVRVGQFIGWLGVASLPTVSVGLGLAERVVRRHVSRLEGLGWLGRAAALRGDGSLVWLTTDGLQGVGLGELRALRAPDPFSAATRQSVRVGWSAARVQRRGYEWRSVRELALDPERWSIAVANERGGMSRRLPDLAVWAPESPLPAALVIEHGVKREQRLRMVLEGWQAAIRAGRYARVQYDCSSPVVARQLNQIAAQIGLPSSQFRAVEQIPLEQIAQLPRPSPIRQRPPPRPRSRRRLRPSAPLRRPNRHSTATRHRRRLRSRHRRPSRQRNVNA